MICFSCAGPEYGTTEAAWKGALSEADRRADLHIRYRRACPTVSYVEKFSVADPDPVSGAFLIPGSGMGKNQDPGSRIRDEQPESYFRELRKNFLG